MSEPISCANIGYAGRDLDDFCACLRDVAIEAVIDVRASPWSRRPEYRKGALKSLLASEGIDYIHCEAAGNPFRPKGNRRNVEECAAQYARHLEGNPHILDAVETLVRSRWSALLCYESKRNECHRGLLLNALKERHPTMDIVDL